jgi:hypothetical protein
MMLYWWSIVRFPLASIIHTDIALYQHLCQFAELKNAVMSACYDSGRKCLNAVGVCIFLQMWFAGWLKVRKNGGLWKDCKKIHCSFFYDQDLGRERKCEKGGGNPEQMMPGAGY